MNSGGRGGGGWAPWTAFLAYSVKVKVEQFTLKVQQALRLLLNLLFCYFNLSEPTYKFQSIKLLDV